MLKLPFSTLNISRKWLRLVFPFLIHGHGIKGSCFIKVDIRVIKGSINSVCLKNVIYLEEVEWFSKIWVDLVMYEVVYVKYIIVCVCLCILDFLMCQSSATHFVDKEWKT